MNINFLFGWAKENGIDLPTKSDGSINIPAGKKKKPREKKMEKNASIKPMFLPATK